MQWGSEIEIERHRRIKVALWAYAYEVMNDSLVDDATFDSTCLQINPHIHTGKLDDFFATKFSPYTGMWIYKHPELDMVAALYERTTGKQAVYTDIKMETDVPAPKAASPFNTHFEMKIYLASLGFNVIPGSLVGGQFGRLDYTFDKESFTVTQPRSGIAKTIMYKDWFLPRSK